MWRAPWSPFGEALEANKGQGGIRWRCWPSAWPTRAEMSWRLRGEPMLGRGESAVFPGITPRAAVEAIWER